MYWFSPITQLVISASTPEIFHEITGIAISANNEAIV
jgi:hypothetical protein